MSLELGSKIEPATHFLQCKKWGKDVLSLLWTEDSWAEGIAKYKFSSNCKFLGSVIERLIDRRWFDSSPPQLNINWFWVDI